MTMYEWWNRMWGKYWTMWNALAQNIVSNCLFSLTLTPACRVAPQNPELHHIKADAKADFRPLQQQMPANLCTFVQMLQNKSENKIVLYTSEIKKWTNLSP